MPDELIHLLVGADGVDPAALHAPVQAAVDDVGALGPQVDEARLQGIRADGIDGAGDTQVLRGVIARDPPVFDGEDVPAAGEGVDHPVPVGHEAADVGLIHLWIVQGMEGPLRVHVGDAHGGAQEHVALRVFRQGVDGGGGQAVVPGVEGESLVLQHGGAAVVGADPHAAPGIPQEAVHAGDPGGGVVAVEFPAVEADEAAEAADEDEAALRLDDVVGLGGGQAAGVVVEHGGIPVAHRVGSRDRRLRRSQSGQQDEGAEQRRRHEGAEPAAQPPAPGPFRFLFHKAPPPPGPERPAAERLRMDYTKQGLRIQGPRLLTARALPCSPRGSAPCPSRGRGRGRRRPWE